MKRETETSAQSSDSEGQARRGNTPDGSGRTPHHEPEADHENQDHRGSAASIAPGGQPTRPDAPQRETASIDREGGLKLSSATTACKDEADAPASAPESPLLENQTEINAMGSRPRAPATSSRRPEPSKACPWSPIRRKFKYLPEPSPGWENAVRCLEDSECGL